MEIVKYAKMNPNKNTTILVFSKFKRSRYPEVANKLMQMESVCAEQVGFVESVKGVYRLFMMGGEFCANATASLSSFLAYKEKLNEGECRDYRIEVSGEKDAVCTQVYACKEKHQVKVKMPIPNRIYSQKILCEGAYIEYEVVEYSGIVHAILSNVNSKRVAKKVLDSISKGERCIAKGVIMFSEEAKSISALVHVYDTKTEVWENSCGSGTAAIAALLTYKKKEKTEMNITQPSGEKIFASCIYRNGYIEELSITGNVRISSVGEAFIV